MTDVEKFYDGLAEPLGERRALAAERSASSKRSTSWFGFTYPDQVWDYGLRLARLGHASKLTDETASRCEAILPILPPQFSGESKVYAWKPWIDGLAAHGLTKEALGRDAWAAGVGPWPKEHAGRLAFTLAFLEADLMFFRSGCMKKGLIGRLRKVARGDQTIHPRCAALVERAVAEGCGLEEAREYRKLAAVVADEGLMERLRRMAAGALLKSWDIPHSEWPPSLEAKLFNAFCRDSYRRPSNRRPHLAVFDLESGAIERHPVERACSKENLAARDAFRTLRHVEIVRGLPSRAWNPAI